MRLTGHEGPRDNRPVTASSSSRHHAPDPGIVIREASSTADFAAVVDLQASVWAAPSTIVPVAQLIAAAHAGGTVLVARDPARADRPVAFCYGFVGLDATSSDPLPASESRTTSAWGEPILWSHMLAVLAEYRGRGLGRRLKVTQADLARRRGLSRVQWTFDPLEAGNARLNLVGLGAIAARYSVNRYGPMDDVLNAGLETDRLIADWHVGQNAPSQDRPTRARPADDAVLLNPDTPHGRVLPVPEAGRVELRIAVPAGVWRDDRRLASAWRVNVRQAFLAALDAGYVAVDIEFEDDLAYYRLERR